MATRLILGYRRKQSYAFANCEPWTRLLVEVGSDADASGYVMPGRLALHKTGQPRLVGLRCMVVEQLESNTELAQTALDATAWWLERSILGVRQLEVTLVHRGCIRGLVTLPSWHVTTLDLSTTAAPCCDAAVDLKDIAPLLPHLTALYLAAPPARRAEKARPILCPMLLAHCTRTLRQISLRGTQGVTNLRDWVASVPLLHTLDLTGCLTLADMETDAKLSALEVFRASNTPVRRLSFLNHSPCLREVHVNGCGNLRDFSPFASAARCLTTLQVSFTLIHSLEPFQRCYALEILAVEGCTALTSLEAVAGFPHLRRVEARGSGVLNLIGLARCPSLTYVDVRECRRLRCLLGLSGAPALRMLKASITPVSSVLSLTTCPLLTEVHVSDCEALTSLSCLAGATSLVKLNAARGAIDTISGLHQCHQLTTVYLDHNPSLQDLSAFAGAHSLTTLNASFTGVMCVDGLAKCPNLTFLQLRGCRALTNVKGLAGCPRLLELSVADSGVGSLDGLQSCPSLERLDVSYCASLHHLTSLRESSSLTVLCASCSGVAQLDDFPHCPNLTELLLDGCTYLENLGPLVQCRSLCALDISDTPVSTLSALAALPCLRHVTARGCRRLRDVATLTSVEVTQD